MTAQTNIYYAEKMKTARTKPQFSQQPNKLGIKVGGVLNQKIEPIDFCFIKLIKKKTPSSPKMAVNLLNSSILFHVS